MRNGLEDRTCRVLFVQFVFVRVQITFYFKIKRLIVCGHSIQIYRSEAGLEKNIFEKFSRKFSRQFKIGQQPKICGYNQFSSMCAFQIFDSEQFRCQFSSFVTAKIYSTAEHQVACRFSMLYKFGNQLPSKHSILL